MPRNAPTFEDVRIVALALPGVEESTIHGQPSLKLRGRLFACPAIHRSAEPDTLALRMPHTERARLLAEEPDRCYVTEHYEKHPMVLVRLPRISVRWLRQLLKRAWQIAAEA
jgi:hypothetical protein